MRCFRTVNGLFAAIVVAFVLGCEVAPPPVEPEREQVANPPQQPAEPAGLDPVHLGEDRLRSPLLESLRQQIENSETGETREVTEPLAKQLDSADVILAEARDRNRAAIQQANRQVRLGAARLSPNFVLITVDRMGVGDLGCYGQSRWETSALDKLAADGMRFTQCYSGLNPSSSQASLLTGQFFVAPSSRASASLSKVLWNAGYKTALIGEWSDELPPAAQGYEESSGWNVTPPEFPEWALLNGKRITLENNAGGQRQASSIDFLVSEVRSFLRESRGRPNQFFLHVSLRLFGDVADRSWNAEEYQACIQRADTAAGRIFDAVDEFGLSNRTCLVFLATAGPHTAMSNLIRELQSTAEFSHNTDGLREGNLRVPFLVRWPGQISAGSVSESTIGLWDVLPTLAQLAAVSRPFGRVDGQSLVEVLRHNQPLKERRIVWRTSTDGSVLAVREGNWKAVRGEAANFQLFDLATDRNEARDVAAEHADVLQRLTKQ